MVADHSHFMSVMGQGVVGVRRVRPVVEIHYSLSLRELQIVVEIDEVCVPVACEGNTGQSDLCANIFNVQYTVRAPL